MSTDSLTHTPQGSWTFDSQVGDCFDDMVLRSVPLYRESIDLLARLALPHLGAGRECTIVDLGCSNGQALKAMLDIANGQPIQRKLKVIAVDREQHMLVRARERLGGTIEYVEHDLRQPLPWMVTNTKPNVVSLLWTAQFIPIEHRARLFREVRECIAANGCLLVAEKLRGQTSVFQQALAREYHQWKVRQGGYSEESVAKKAESLEGVLVSLSAPEQKAFMTAEGWHVEEVTRYLGFAAYYCLPK